MTAIRKHFAEIILVVSIIYIGWFGMQTYMDAKMGHEIVGRLD